MRPCLTVINGPTPCPKRVPHQSHILLRPRLKTYINFDVLHSLGHEGRTRRVLFILGIAEPNRDRIDPDSCIANRGLLLIDASSLQHNSWPSLQPWRMPGSSLECHEDHRVDRKLAGRELEREDCGLDLHKLVLAKDVYRASDVDLWVCS